MVVCGISMTTHTLSQLCVPCVIKLTMTSCFLVYSDDNIDILVKEANMPIEDVLVNCVNDKKLVKNLVDLANKG